MAEATDAPAETADAPTPDVTPEPDKPRVDVPPEVAAALRKAHKEAETLRRQLKDYEDRDKTEAEKLAERATQAEAALADLQKQALRSQVALAKGVPADLVDRLRGDTEEELAADADALLALVKPAEPEPAAQVFPDLGQGQRTPASAMALNGDPLLQAVVEKLKH